MKLHKTLRKGTIERDDYLPVADMLSELLKVIGIDLSRMPHRMNQSMNYSKSKTFQTSSSTGAMNTSTQRLYNESGGFVSGEQETSALEMNDDFLAGVVVVPSSERPEDHYAGSSRLGRQSMLIRMERLFDDVADRLTKVTYASKTEEYNTVHLPLLEDHVPPDMSPSYTSKPVVIGDAVPVPAKCPKAVEQLLEAALAHHNLGSFQESLKFLEAARLQQIELFRKEAEARRVAAAIRKKEKEAEAERARALEEAKAHAKGKIKEKDRRSSFDEVSTRSEGSQTMTGASENKTGGGDTTGKPTVETAAADSSAAKFDPRPPVEHELYIVICKGNVYQSSGDDEQALMQYMAGWERAVSRGSADWEVICLNCVGLLCYFNLRYDLALKCFSEVAAYRTEVWAQ